MTSTITLTGDYGYQTYKISNLTDVEIDASDARWIVSNVGDTVNLYPFSVRDSSNVTISGGVIDGQVPLDTDWRETYVNSAAVYSRNVDDVLIRNWIISSAWDAIRVRGDVDDVFTIDNVWITDVRDDAVENDDGLSGTISNSLFDGVFVGISLGDSGTSDQTDQVVTLDNVLIRMSSFPYKGEVTHQSPFKVIEGISPSLSIHDSIIAIEDVDHEGQGRLQIAWDSVVSSSGNYFLNLSDDPLPDDYPMPPEGFTVLQGQEARDYWDNASEDWIADFVGDEELPVDEGTDEDTVDDGTDEDTVDDATGETETPPADGGTSPDVDQDPPAGDGTPTDGPAPDPSEDTDPPATEPVDEDPKDGSPSGPPEAGSGEDPDRGNGRADDQPKHTPTPKGPKPQADAKASTSDDDDGPENVVARFFKMLFSIFNRGDSSDDDGEADLVATSRLESRKDGDSEESVRDSVEDLAKIVPITGYFSKPDDTWDEDQEDEDQMRDVVGF
jgi:hypothetical protein